MVYFTIKGYSYNNNYKKMDETKKAIRIACGEKIAKEHEAREQAIKDSKILREELGKPEIIDFREDPKAKEIIKIGNEVKKMKKYGVPRARIDSELNPEVAKHVKHN